MPVPRAGAVVGRRGGGLRQRAELVRVGEVSVAVVVQRKEIDTGNCLHNAS